MKLTLSQIQQPEFILLYPILLHAITHNTELFIIFFSKLRCFQIIINIFAKVEANLMQKYDFLAASESSVLLQLRGRKKKQNKTPKHNTKTHTIKTKTNYFLFLK